MSTACIWIQWLIQIDQQLNGTGTEHPVLLLLTTGCKLDAFISNTQPAEQSSSSPNEHLSNAPPFPFVSCNILVWLVLHWFSDPQYAPCMNPGFRRKRFKNLSKVTHLSLLSRSHMFTFGSLFAHNHLSIRSIILCQHQMRSKQPVFQCPSNFCQVASPKAITHKISVWQHATAIVVYIQTVVYSYVRACVTAKTALQIIIQNIPELYDVFKNC